MSKTSAETGDGEATSPQHGGSIGTITERIAPPDHSSRDGSPAGDRPFSHPLSDRRRATRVKKKFVTQMTPWAPGRPSIPFEVIIDDVSNTGVGLIHHEPLEMGLRHLLTVPRVDEKPVMLEYIVCRCDRRPDGRYSIGLTAADDVYVPLTDAAGPKRLTTRTTKILFLLFGIFGIIIAAFAPL